MLNKDIDRAGSRGAQQVPFSYHPFVTSSFLTKAIARAVDSQ